MQVSFTAHTPAHSPLTIQQRLEAAGCTNVHVNAISDTVEPGHDVTHQECFGRFTVLALSLNAAIRKCMRRVARMCADCSAREQLDHQEGARA